MDKKYKIRVLYDEILKKPTKQVEVFDENLEILANNMRDIMHKNRGMGLSANQIGLDMQLFVIELKPDKNKKISEIPFTTIVNPEIIRTSNEKDKMVEGCLSLPGLEAEVERSTGITLKGQTIKGKKVQIKTKGLFARIIQHETDHLNGILFTKRAKLINLDNCKFAKILFFGSDEFSIDILKKIITSGLSVTNVITESDKPAGRNMKLTPTPVKKYCIDNNISVLTPEKENITEVVKDLKPDLIILASYGKILPSETLNIPPFGAINIHPSLLPKYRGSTPIHTAILNGDEKTGSTVMLMNEKVDEGKIIAQKELIIEKTDTTQTLKQKLAVLGADILLKELPKYMAGLKEPSSQYDISESKTFKLSKDLAKIDWDKPIDYIDRQIRALKPWPGTYTNLDDKKLQILKARHNGEKLEIEEVQLEGKKPANWADFKRGHLNRLTKQLWFSKII